MTANVLRHGITNHDVHLPDDHFCNLSQTAEHPGQFIGEGAKSLALRGTVTRAEFRPLFEGFGPNGALRVEEEK